MTDSISDILGDYVVKRPVQAVRLDDAATIGRVGRWINENGANCSWVSASGAVAIARAGDDVNHLWLYRDPEGKRSEMAGLGDWVVHVSGSEFLLVSNENFTAAYSPTTQEIAS